MYRYLFLILFLPHIMYSASLQEAIVHAMTNNPTMQAAQHDLSAKKLQNMQSAINSFLPTVNGFLSHNLREDNFWPLSAGISVNQQVFNFGGDVASLYKGSIASEAAHKEFLLQRQRLILAVVKSYVNVIEKRQMYKLHQENVEVLEENLAAATQRFQVGETTKTILEKERSKLARARSECISAKGELNNAYANYLHVVGMEAEDLTMPSSDDIGTIPISLAEALDQALINNLQVQSSALMSKSAYYATLEATARMLPSVSLGVQLTQNRLRGGNNEYSATIGLSTNISLFRGSADYMKVQQAQHMQSKYKYNHIETINAIKEAVTNAWNNFITIKSMVESSQKEIDSAQIVLESVKEEEKMNVKTPLDVIEAHNELLKAKARYLVNKMKRITALYNLIMLTQSIEIASDG